MRPALTLPVVLAVCLLSGCATHYKPEDIHDPFGFLSGFWHGLILPISLLINLASWVCSLFGFDMLSSIEIIGRPNTGFWYYLGFLLGIGSLGGARQ